MIRAGGFIFPIYTPMELLTAQTKECPFCGEIIQSRALKCRYCAEFLNTAEAKALKVANDPDAEQAEEKDKVLFWARPSLWAMARPAVKGLIVFCFAVFLMKFAFESWLSAALNLDLTENQIITIGKYRAITGTGIAIVVMLLLLLKVVKIKMTYYEVTADRIEWGRGIFDRQVDNLDMFRVIDLKLRRSLLDCIVGVGTVVPGSCCQPL